MRIKPKRRIRRRRRSRAAPVYAPEGYPLRSKAELKIEQFFHAKGIPHIYEPKGSTFAPFWPDWLVGKDLIVEYFGVTNNYYRGYDAKTRRKIEKFSQMPGYRFLALYPKDLSKLEQIFTTWGPF